MGDVPEVVVSRQQRQPVTDAQPGEQSVNRSDLDARTAAAVLQLGGPDVIVSVRNNEGNGRKAFKNLLTSRWSGKALQDLLQHQAGGDHGVSGFECPDQCAHFFGRRRTIASQRQRPYTGVDEQRQSRERSAL